MPPDKVVNGVAHDLKLLGLVRMPSNWRNLNIVYRMSVKREHRQYGGRETELAALKAAYERLQERM